MSEKAEKSYMHTYYLPSSTQKFFMVNKHSWQFSHMMHFAYKYMLRKYNLQYVLVDEQGRHSFGFMGLKPPQNLQQIFLDYS